jgi:hypothetical protein
VDSCYNLPVWSGLDSPDPENGRADDEGIFLETVRLRLDEPIFFHEAFDFDLMGVEIGNDSGLAEGLLSCHPPTGSGFIIFIYGGCMT